MKKALILWCSVLCALSFHSLDGQDITIKNVMSGGDALPDSLWYVNAQPMDSQTWCRVTWNWNSYVWEIGFDDGSAEDLILFQNPGNMNAVRFTPPGYPMWVRGGRVFVGDGFFPGPFLGTDFRMIVFDDDGEDGLPGTALDSITATVTNYKWVYFDGFNVIISGGDFYLAMKQLAPAPDAAPLGVDMQSPTYHRSYTKIGDNSWMLSVYQDIMIRAWCSNGSDSAVYLVDRFAHFDPNGSPLLGDTTHLTITSSHYYNDYQWDTLEPGWYAYGVQEYVEGTGWSEYFVSNIVGFPEYLEQPSCFYQADTGNKPLVFCPPMDTNGSVPFNFWGYGLYLDGENVEYLPYSINSYEPEVTSPCHLIYELAAVYDMAPYGQPYEYGESSPLQTTYQIRYGFELDFIETWESGSFDTNNWSAEGPNWTVTNVSGHPSLCAAFTWDPIQTQYDMSLSSYPLLADSLSIGQIFLDFDLLLNDVGTSGTEFMYAEVWDWTSQEWQMVAGFSNAGGQIYWESQHLDITEYAMGQVFRVRFRASGENSVNILNWAVDNIHIYRECEAPYNLWAEWEEQNYMLLVTWELPIYEEFDKFVIYRSDMGGPYFIRDYTTEHFYLDDSICLMSLGNYAHEYKVTAVNSEAGDYCESAFSNEGYEVCEGVNENEDSPWINIYPNPARDKFMIESDFMIQSISLYDACGQLIIKEIINKKRSSLPVSRYPAGIYLIRAETRDNIISGKIVIQR